VLPTSRHCFELTTTVTETDRLSIRQLPRHAVWTIVGASAGRLLPLTLSGVKNCGRRSAVAVAVRSRSQLPRSRAWGEVGSLTVVGNSVARMCHASRVRSEHTVPNRRGTVLPKKGEPLGLTKEMILAPDDIFIEVDDWFVVSIECSSGLFVSHDRNLFAGGSSRTHCCYLEGFNSPHRCLHGRGVAVRLCRNDVHLEALTPSGLTKRAAYHRSSNR
jgi:hypothetical protein